MPRSNGSGSVRIEAFGVPTREFIKTSADHIRQLRQQVDVERVNFVCAITQVGLTFVHLAAFSAEPSEKTIQYTLKASDRYETASRVIRRLQWAPEWLKSDLKVLQDALVELADGLS